MQALVASLGLESKVRFYGLVTKPEEWYPEIDIFISNSYSEGLQVSPLEAVASGCYLLSHRWEGVEELLEAENLYYTDSELIDKICSYASLSDAERRSKQEHLQAVVAEHNNVDRTKVLICQAIEESVKAYR
jgi:glycosyltransferase involved in cell wall biosynthesis